MRRRAFLAGSSGIGLAALAGCVSSATDPDNSDPSGSTGDNRRTISVEASGEVYAEPDLARFSAGVEASGTDAKSVRDQLAEGIDDVHEALREAGIPADSITTERLRVREGRHQFEGSHSLSVTLDDADDVGEYVDVAVDAGADDIGRVSFTLADETREELRNDALAIAVEEARSEADHIASEANAVVTDVAHIDATGSRVSPVRAEYDIVDDVDDSPTQVYSDDVSVRASVSVVYDIETQTQR